MNIYYMQWTLLGRWDVPLGAGAPSLDNGKEILIKNNKIPIEKTFKSRVFCIQMDTVCTLCPPSWPLIHVKTNYRLSLSTAAENPYHSFFKPVTKEPAVTWWKPKTKCSPGCFLRHGKHLADLCSPGAIPVKVLVKPRHVRSQADGHRGRVEALQETAFLQFLWLQLDLFRSARGGKWSDTGMWREVSHQIEYV